MEQRGHHFELAVPSTPLLVEGDTPRLTQVFANLINNAAKYTEPGGHIAVHVSPRDRWICIDVRDDGIGIAPGLLGKIFEPFVQGQDGTERQSEQQAQSEQQCDRELLAAVAVDTPGPAA